MSHALSEIHSLIFVPLKPSICPDMRLAAQRERWGEFVPRPSLLWKLFWKSCQSCFQTKKWVFLFWCCCSVTFHRVILNHETFPGPFMHIDEPFVQVHVILKCLQLKPFLTSWIEAIATNHIKLKWCLILALSNEFHVYFSTWTLSKITAPDASFTFFSPRSKCPYSF